MKQTLCKYSEFLIIISKPVSNAPKTTLELSIRASWNPYFFSIHENVLKRKVGGPT